MNALLPLILAVAPALPADRPKFDPDAHARAVAPFVEGRTFGVLRVDLTRLDADELSKRISAVVGRDVAEDVGVALKRLSGLTKAGAHDAYVVFSLADLPNSPPVVVIPATGDTAKAIARELPKAAPVAPEGIAELGGAVVVGAPPALKRLRDLKPEARPEIARAFATAGPGFAQLVLVPTTDLPRILDEVLPKLPPELGGGSTKVLSHGLKSIALAVDAEPALRVRLTVQAADAAAAKELHGLLLTAAKALTMQAEKGVIPLDLQAFLTLLTPKVQGDRLTLDLDEATLVKELRQPAERVRAAAARAQSMNNLKQLGIALHNYHSTYGHFPAAAITGKGDKPLLSWRVHVLPYIEEDNLYKEFHHDEPWDSEHNKKLVARMPAVFRSTTDEKVWKAGKTTYLAPRGKDLMFPPGKGVRVTDVTDGLSNTILLVDAADERAVVWTKPEDLPVDAADPAKGLAARDDKSFIVLIADGSVRGVSAKLDKKMMWALFTRNGGEVIREP